VPTSQGVEVILQKGGVNVLNKGAPVSPLAATVAIVVVLVVVVSGGWYLFLRPKPGEANKPDTAGMPNQAQEDARIRAGGMPRIPGQSVPPGSAAAGGAGATR
jgi:hypothetical protein